MRLCRNLKKQSKRKQQKKEQRKRKFNKQSLNIDFSSFYREIICKNIGKREMILLGYQRIAKTCTTTMISNSLWNSKNLLVHSQRSNLHNKNHPLPLRSFSSQANATHDKSSSMDFSHAYCNVPINIQEKIGRNLHLLPHHPLSILKKKVELYFKTLENEPSFALFDSLSPIVSTTQCFDDLLTPKDHVSRSIQDTYYLNHDTLLRTHTTAHQTTLLKNKCKAFLVSGDVYRRDEIDACHYPVFHQLDGVRLFPEVRYHYFLFLEIVVLEIFLNVAGKNTILKKS